MAYQKQDFSALANFLPPGCLEDILPYIFDHKIQLKITPDRSSILGNYIYNTHTKRHSISVNGTLNPFSFLVTLLHEIAHCLCFVQFGKNAAPHGLEWQSIYSQLLQEFIKKNIFPQDIVEALLKNVHNPKASSCADASLQKALEKYDTNKPQSVVYVEDIPLYQHFITAKGKIFKKLKKRRTRYLCSELNTNELFLFPPLYKVKPYSIGTS